MREEALLAQVRILTEKHEVLAAASCPCFRLARGRGSGYSRPGHAVGCSVVDQGTLGGGVAPPVRRSGIIAEAT